MKEKILDVKSNFYGYDASSQNSLILLNPNELYPDADDFRKNLIGESSNNGKIISYKYAKLGSSTSNSGIIPMIRLTEMYFIAADCSYESNKDEAVEYLKKVRKMRGASQTVKTDSYEAFVKDLTTEVKREFLGEGQMFYWYKCHNLASPRNGQDLQLTQQQRCLPMSANEVEFGNRIEDYLKY